MQTTGELMLDICDRLVEEKEQEWIWQDKMDHPESEPKPEELKKPIDIEHIQTVVCDYFNISREQLHKVTRKREVVQARQIAMYFSKSLTKCSLATIGSKIGGKDHATVLNGCKVVNQLIETDITFARQIEEIEAKINGKEIPKRVMIENPVIQEPKRYKTRSYVSEKMKEAEPEQKIERPKGEYSNLREINDPTFQLNSFRINKY